MDATLLLETCEVDLQLGLVQRGAQQIPLTSRECELLRYLVQRAGTDVERTELLTEVWGYAPAAKTRAIDQIVRKLRRKLEGDRTRPRHILTATGCGYRFEGLPPPTERYGDRFVGRSDLLESIAEVLGSPGAAWLHGPPGAGKTRLAWELLRERRGWFCGLTGARSEAEVTERVATELGVRLDPATSLEERVARVGHALSRASESLLVLDNAEPLDLAGVLPPWLQAAPRLRVLVTSQHPVAHAVRIEVSGIGDTGPVLFLERARDRWPAFRADPGEVAALCARLDGLPLAIELAAARVRLLSVPDMLRRMEHQLSLLRRSDRQDHHASLEATIAWAWDLLTPEARQTLSWLAVLPGGFDAAAAEAVLGADALDRVDHVEQLALVQSTRTGSRVRLRLYEAVRAWVDAHAPPPDEAWSRHLDHRITTVGATFDPAELPNLHAVLRRATSLDPDRAATLLVRMLLAPWHGAITERLAWVEAVQTSGPSGEDAERLIAHRVNLLWLLGRATEAEDVAVRGLRTAHTTVGRARILHIRGVLLAGQRRPDDALGVLDEALSLLDPDSFEAFCVVRSRADALRALGRRTESSAVLQQALRNARARGHDGQMGNTMVQLAHLSVVEGGPRAAAELLADASRAYERADDKDGRALAAGTRASLALELGRLSLARQEIACFEEHAHRVGGAEWLRGAGLVRAVIALESGAVPTALGLLEALEPRHDGPEAIATAVTLLLSSRGSEALPWLAPEHDHLEDACIRACLRSIASGDTDALDYAEPRTPTETAMVRVTRAQRGDEAARELAQESLYLRQLLRVLEG